MKRYVGEWGPKTGRAKALPDGRTSKFLGIGFPQVKITEVNKADE